MTREQMLALGTALAAYLRWFEKCLAYRPTAEHLHLYFRGLLSDLARQSMEPIALACGTAVRTLQQFLSDHVWDHLLSGVSREPLTTKEQPPVFWMRRTEKP